MFTFWFKRDTASIFRAEGSMNNFSDYLDVISSFLKMEARH
jgi:hypothetical protein